MPPHHAPSMTRFPIFAGLDAQGITRFVADVPGGAACGCHCAACGAALVAKRGDVKIWHFAHEASQERPECFAGAVNLLRRLAAQDLAIRSPVVAPTAYVVVDTSAPLPHMADAAHEAQTRHEKVFPALHRDGARHRVHCLHRRGVTPFGRTDIFGRCTSPAVCPMSASTPGAGVPVGTLGNPAPFAQAT